MGAKLDLFSEFPLKVSLVGGGLNPLNKTVFEYTVKMYL